MSTFAFVVCVGHGSLGAAAKGQSVRGRERSGSAAERKKEEKDEGSDKTN